MRCFFLVTAVTVVAAGGPIAQTSFGQLRGVVVTNDAGTAHAEAFLGVPFAEPPTGDLRFAAPVDWSTPYTGGTLDATRYGELCPQTLGGASTTVVGTEDCLQLNVWRPAGTKAGDKLPVQFFVYGGAWVVGGGSFSGYNGTNVATAHNVIVVTTSYRLGALGFLAFGDTNSTGAGPVSANHGFKDQQSALRWLHAQADSLGGDPDRVMIYGESAGGVSVMHHAVSPASAGLFSRALSESGFPHAVWTGAYAVQRSADFGARLGCDAAAAAAERLACMRSKPLADVMAAQAADASVGAGNPLITTGWRPTVDGAGGSLPANPLKLYAAGAIHASIDAFAAGTNHNEGALFVLPYFPQGMNESVYADTLNAAFNKGGHVLNASTLAAVRDLYPCASPTDCGQALADATADAHFVCGTRWVIRGVAARNGAQTVAGKGATTAAYLYHWNYRSVNDHNKSATFSDALGVYHTSELPFVFGTPHAHYFDMNVSLWDMTPADHALADQIGRYWSSLATSGTPNGRGIGAHWPAYAASADTNLRVDMNGAINTEVGRRKKLCDFWESTQVFALW